MTKITMTVWTNGKAIRKYTGQDKHSSYNHEKRNGTWYKAIAVITKEEEPNETTTRTTNR